MDNILILDQTIKYLPGNFWTNEIFGNSIFNYLTFLGLFVILCFVFYIVTIIITSNLRRLALKTETGIDDLALQSFKTIKPKFYNFLAFYLAVQTLNTHHLILEISKAILIFAVVYQGTKIIQIIINYLSLREEKKETTDGASSLAIQTIGKLVKVVIWSFALLFTLSNFGIDITSLIAGLGIGGVAVALALQNILGDLFSYFAINFDKPFVPGDFIIVGDKMGVVEKIGIKTTRVRALQGEELVFSNKELSGSQIQNFKRMQDRRVSFDLGIVYGTPLEKIKKIPEIIKGIITSTDKTRFDRAHFKSFGSFSLDFEIVYYTLTADYNEYMDANQEIHLKIAEAFEKEGIDFAFPTQTIHLNKS